MLRFFTFGLMVLFLVAAGCDRSAGMHQGEKLHPVAIASKPQKIATEKPCCTILVADVYIPTSSVSKAENKESTVCTTALFFKPGVTLPFDDPEFDQKMKGLLASGDAYHAIKCP